MLGFSDNHCVRRWLSSEYSPGVAACDFRCSTDALPVTSLRVKPTAAVLEPIPREDAAATTKVFPVDDMVRRLNRLCWIVNHKSVTGRLIQMAIQIGGAGIGKLNENMYLNQVPHNRYVRKYFYNMAAVATLEAVQLCSQGKISNRMKLISMFPEMNPSMDSYRYVFS